MAADNPNVIAFDFEADQFVLRKRRTGVEFLVNGDSMVPDLPGAKVNRETREVTFMGRKAGNVSAEQDIEALASTLETWFPPGTVEHTHSEQEFNQQKQSGIVVAKFTAEWCGPCKMVAPKIEAMSLKYPDVKFLHIDGDQNKDLMRKYGANCFPTFMFFQDGNICKNGNEPIKIEGADAGKVESTIKTLGAQAGSEPPYTGDGEVTIVVDRDSYVVEKEAAGVSLSVNGDKVIPAGKCPDLELNRSTRKVTIGRGGGVLYNGPGSNVEEIMDKIEAMFPNKVVHVHKMSEFDEIVRNNANVVAKFSAAWCGPCHAIAPFVKDLANKNENVVFVHIDVDEVKDLSRREDVKAMPTFDFYKNGSKLANKRIRGGNRAKLSAQVAEFGQN